MAAARPDGRAEDALRPIRFTPDPAPAAAGSVLVEFGRTRVICGASVEDGVPRWMRAQNISGGWLTAEYSLLPYATRPRNSRESSTGKVSGRTQEIQRLIGRSLRAVTDLDKLGVRTIWLDCDVLEADGGTRTAAVTGAWVALRRAVNRLLREGVLTEDPLREAVAAVSVGLVEGRACLDLCYQEDLAAAVDLNVVMTASGRFVEVQGTAEESPFSREELDAMLALAARGIRRLLKAQQLVSKR
ncbi:MAG: ribonuclease PH [Verrucomicrobia bacterium]|nr:ribonuclease PH [Verrucomicrobiota bacterium]